MESRFAQVREVLYECLSNANGVPATMRSTFVNLSDYPVDQPKCHEYRSMVERLKQELAAAGLVILPNFVTEAGVHKFNDEIDRRMPDAYFSEHGPNAYFDDYPGELPYEILNSTSYCLGRDKLLNSEMDNLYRWPPMRQLIGDITGNGSIYLHEDPSNALIVQMYKPGCEIGWHFDRALFACIINLREPTAGGVFECVPDLRSERDPCYDEVREVLEGRSARVQSHRVSAGSLTVMLGRHTFHRVTRVEREEPRTSLVLTYELKPGVRIDAADRRTIFGPNAPS